MTPDLDRSIRSALSDIVATTPQPDVQPVQLVPVHRIVPRRSPYFAVAATLVAVVGLAGGIALLRHDPSTSTPGGAPSTQADGIDPAPTANTTASQDCVSPSARPLVPNVSGMSFADAKAVLIGAGLDWAISSSQVDGNTPPHELPLSGNATEADYVVTQQNIPPGESVGCGTPVEITVAYRPGITDTPAGNTTTTLGSCEPSNTPPLAVVVNASHVNDTATSWTNLLATNVPTVDFADPEKAAAPATVSRVLALDGFECNASLLAHLTTGGAVEPATAETLQALVAQPLPLGTSIVVIIGDDKLSTATTAATTTSTTAAP